MKAAYFAFALMSSIIEGQLIYPGYWTDNYWRPQILMRPVLQPRLLPFSEEIVMESVVEESSYFKIKSKNINEWHRLQLDTGDQYLLGVGDRELTLISMYRTKENTYQVHEYPMAMSYKINSVAMFKTPSVSRGLHPEHGFVLIGFGSLEPICVLYKIRNFKLANMTSLKREHKVQSVAHFVWHNEHKIVIVEDHGDISFINVFGLKFEKHLPHYWHIETLSMNKIEGHPSFGSFKDGRIYMAVIQSMDSTVKVYAYKDVCYASGFSLSGSKFELVRFPTAVVAKKIVFFESYDRKYMMTVSLHTMLYAISHEDHLVEDTKFTLSADMIVLPLSGSKGGALLLGKSLDGNPHVYIYSSTDDQWRESPTPKCRRSEMHATEGMVKEVDLKDCIGGSRSWTGASYIDTGYPSLLFSDRIYPGELYHFPYSIKTIEQTPSILDNTIDEIEEVWRRIKANWLDVGRSADLTEPHPICSALPELTRMHQMLSNLRDRQALAGCSIRAELAQQQAEHNVVVDEGKPQEVISKPSDGADRILKSGAGSHVGEKRIPYMTEPSSPHDYYNTRKTTVLSPELVDVKWEDREMNDLLVT